MTLLRLSHVATSIVMSCLLSVFFFAALLAVVDSFPARRPQRPTVRGRPAAVPGLRPMVSRRILPSFPHIRFENTLRRLILSSHRSSSSPNQRVMSLITDDPTSAFHLAMDCSALTTALEELDGDPSALSQAGISPQLCQGAERSIRRAMGRIASEFRFRRPVTVHVSLFIPCADVTATDEEQCPELGLLAEASITQRLPVRHLDDNQVYMYPTALLKQMDFDGLDTVEWPQYDVVAQINAKRDWWFGPTDGDSSEADMPEGLRDLELTCMHEIMHGLAYGDDLSMTYRPNEQLEIVTPYYESARGDPLPVEFQGTLAYNDEVNFYRFSRPSIWDRFTRAVNSSTAIRDFGTNLTQVVNRLISQGHIRPRPISSVSATATGALGRGAYDPNTVFDTLLGTADGKQLVETLYQLGTTPGAVVFDPTAWPPPSSDLARRHSDADSPPPSPMETGISPFTSGSSVSHFAMPTPGDTDVHTAPLNSSAEFLMFWRAGHISLDRLIRESGAPASGIGPATKAAMVAMGFTSHDAPGWNTRRSVAQLDWDVGERPLEQVDTDEIIGLPSKSHTTTPPWFCAALILGLALVSTAV